MSKDKQRTQFSKNPDYDFEIRVTLGQAPAGGADVGEVLAAVHNVKAKDADGWFAAWTALAERTAAAADAASTDGHEVSAAAKYLRAANYYAVGVNAASTLKDSEELLPTFRRHRDAWDNFVRNAPFPVESVEIPYVDAALPGYFFRPDDSGAARPTLVMNNGSDGAISSLWGSGGRDALERGYNVLLYDGPGQQTMLFERNTTFRADWEAVLTPVVDFLVARADVDARKLAVFGISQSGYWVARAIAFEQRFAAAIVDPGVVDVASSWDANLPKALLKLADKGKGEKFDKDMRIGFKLSPETERVWTFRARPYGTESYYATLKAVREHQLDAQTAAKIKTPLLITQPEGEQFWPGQSAQLAALTADVSSLVDFTAAEGADFHCQPLARSLTHERVFDWLDGVLAGES